MPTNLVDSLSPYTVQRIRYLEWLFLFTHLLLGISDGEYDLLRCFFVYGVLIIFSCILPIDRTLELRRFYIFSAILFIVGANFFDVGLDLLVFLYIAKSFFFIGEKSTIWVSIFTGVGWVISEYYLESQKFERLHSLRFESSFIAGNYTPQAILIFSLGIYIAVSTFTIFFSSIIVAEYKSRKRAEALAEQVEILTIDLERTRIARDIHDSIGHNLTNLDMQIRVARKLRTHDLDRTWDAIDKASMLSAQCIEDVSHAVRTMRRSDFNLDHALSNLVEQVRNDSYGSGFAKSRVQIQWEIDLPQLSLSTSHQIYCVIKEGLINIQKHSEASEVFFQGYSTSTEIVLKLQDNGVGFNVQQVSLGFGLKGILERVQAIRGRLEIDSIPGQGTQILVTIPR